MRREKDLHKVINYCKLLGIQVRIANLESTEAGNYYPREGSTPPQIFLETKGRSIFTQLMVMLHELGHHIDERERGWEDLDSEAYGLWFDQLEKAPQWAKNRVWNCEEHAHSHIIPTANHLEIDLPAYLFWYDIERSRKQVWIEMEEGKLTRETWREAKREIRERLKERVPPLSVFQPIFY